MSLFDPGSVLAALAYSAGAVASITAAIWLGSRRHRFGAAGTAIIAGLLCTAIWCICVIAAGDGGLISGTAEAARNLVWLFVTYRLFMTDGRHASLAPIRPVVIVLGLVELAHLAASVLVASVPHDPDLTKVAFDLGVVLRLLVAVGGLVLVHNLFAGASRQSQAMLRWPAGGLALFWAVDLNLNTVAYLSGLWPVELAATRGVSILLLAVLLGVGGARSGGTLRFRPSRAVTFQTFSLLVIGAYLVAMVSIAQWLSFAGGDFARLIELAFLTLASALAILVLPSRRLRGWLRVSLTKHLFQHRYDYREEWLRFTRTIGNGGDEALPLGERVVQAVADIAESSAGLLLAPGDNGDLVLAARWHWPSVEVPGVAMPARSVAFFERDGFIVDLDDVRAAREDRGEGGVVPQWLREEPRAWALVPLIHFDRLVGVVVLARPAAPRRFDWEDFDLLRVVGKQLASYLAENSVQEALAESSRFEDFNRRIAFVMHDIKNLASQLSLLARNAEKHAEKPEFRDDMLVTLRNSADKLNTLLARLSRYGANSVEQLSGISAAEVASAVVEQFRGRHPVVLAACEDCEIMANRDSLEQVLVHLIQNSVDASEADSPVFLALSVDGLSARFEVVDSGCGMSPEFVRNRLFKPFVSSKQGGFGIGAFEARELVRAMRGRLEVESREGLGSRFTIRIPLASASDLLETFNSSTAKRLAS